MKVSFFLTLALVAIYLALNKESVEGARILGVFPFQSKSHWNMMEQLMINLANRGHQVDVVTHFPLSTKPIPNYHEISIAGSLGLSMNNMTANDINMFGSMGVQNFVNVIGTTTCELLNLPQLQNLIDNPPNDPPYDLVIIELFAGPCYLPFGRYLKVPIIGVMTSYIDWFYDKIGMPMNPAFVPNVFSSYSQHMTFIERLINTVQFHVSGNLLNYYMGMQEEYIRKNFKMNDSVNDFYKDISLILMNTHYSLSGIRPSTPGVVEVAGVHINDVSDPLAPEVQKWLDESVHGCIYFTFGSMVKIESFSNETVKAFYESFKKLSPTRILMKVAKKEELLPGLPENVMVRPWFPQLSVLKHKNVKVFLTHGGLMSTQESIYYGVPMVGIPLFGDQAANIINYVKKNVAISLKSIDQVTEERLTNALKTVMNDPIYQSSMKKLSQLYKDRPQKPIETAMYWIEYVLRNGNVLQSPAVHLNNWQIHLFDVYGTILLSIVIVLYIVIRILRMLKNCVCPSKTSSNQKAAASRAKKIN